MKKYLFLFFAVAFVFQACKKDGIIEDRDNKEWQTTSSDRSKSELLKHEGTIVLGKKVSNPLTPDNMIQAWNNLYDDKISTLADLSAGTYFVRITSKTNSINKKVILIR